MFKKLTLFGSLVSLTVTVPLSVNAGACSLHGYSVVLVNGIFTSRDQANRSLDALAFAVNSNGLHEEASFHLGYNPSHLGGSGDLIQSVSQAFHDPISTFDLHTILMQIHPEVTTRKILLVGHSQGSFYTNEMYSYLVEYGVPKESIGVYHIATPAVFVAGGGSYITSTNDKVINRVRGTEIDTNLGFRRESYGVIGSVVASALRANITVPPEDGYDENRNGGHAFQVYMDGAGDRILTEIKGALSRLKAGAGDGEEECFSPPEKTVSHQMKATAYAVVDPLAGVVVNTLLAARADIRDSLGNIARTRGAGLGLFSPKSSQLAAAALPFTPEQEPEEPQVRTSESAAERETENLDSPAPALPEPSPAVDTNDTPAPPAAPVPSVPEQDPSQTNTPQVFNIIPGFGGGAAPAADIEPTESAVPVAFSVLAPSNNAYFSSQPVTFSGTADPLAAIYADAGSATSTATADGSGEWSLDLPLPEGSASVDLYASSGGRDSAISTLSLTIDHTAPATTTLTVDECAFSLVSSSCAVPTTNLSLSWMNVIDASAYEILLNSAVHSTTTSASASVDLTADATSTIAVVAYDAAGNSAISDEISVRTLSRPLIINEIGWAGALSGVHNPVHVPDQWIEIKNISSLDLALDNVAFHANGASLVALTGSLPAGSILVVEQTEVPFTGLYKIVSAFPSLSTAAADQLSLVWNGQMIDSTPVSAACSGWCVGSDLIAIGSNTSGRDGLYTPLSMERVRDDADGLLPTSWQSTDSYASTLGSGAYWGTPGNENSVNLPESGVYCGSTSNLAVANASFNPGSGGCVYLSRFISGGPSGVSRYVGLYRGTVASSTQVAVHSDGKSLAYISTDTAPADAISGENFFFAMFENRTFGSDVTDFNSYFTTGAPLPPHGNYVTIPWTYSP